MYITATFPHSIKLEKAIAELQKTGIPQTDILAIPLKHNDKKKNLFDTIGSADGKSMFDLPMIGAAVLSLFGCVYGFVWKLGPIIWGLIGMAAGFGIGLLIKLLIIRKDKGTNKSTAEVVVFISCNANKSEHVRSTLCDNGALGIGVADPKKIIESSQMNNG